jgi:imidazolonepropionase-like amidohydrolase
MKITIRFVSLLVSCLLFQTAAFADLLLKDGNFINPKTKKTFSGHMLIESSGKIKAIYTSVVCPKIPGATVIDLKNNWVLPGLHDMHIHNWGDNLPPTGDYNSPDYDYVGLEGMGSRMLSAGVTTYLDLFAPVEDTMELRARQRAGLVVHPNIFAAGHIFMVPNGHPIGFHPDAIKLTSAADAKTQVETFILAKSPDVIKFVYDNGDRPDGTYVNMTKDIAEAIIKTAHKHGIKAVAHIGTWNGARDLAELGIDAVTHIPEEKMPKDLVALLKKKNVTMITTMVVYMDLGFIAAPATQDEVLDNDLLRKVTTAGHISAYRDPSKYDDVTKLWTDWSLMHNQLGHQFRNLMLLYNGGVNILAGSDSGNTGTFIAYSIHRELKLMVAAGMTPMEALQTATVNSNKFLGQNKGIDIGNIADLFVVNKNPLKDITNTQDVKMVILKGQVVP